MNKKLALIVAAVVWAWGAYFFTRAAIASRQEHAHWVLQNTKELSQLQLPSPEEDVRAGMFNGLAAASGLALLVWLALRSAVPVDENKDIGRAVIDEALETVKGSLPLSAGQERKAREGFWRRFNGLFKG